MPAIELHRAVVVMRLHPDVFTAKFREYLPNNLHVFERFEREAFSVIGKGFKHYSARTILHVLRHHSALRESGGEWKIDNCVSPAFARLFELMHPAHAGLFEMRVTKAVQREAEAA